MAALPTCAAKTPPMPPQLGLFPPHNGSSGGLALSGGVGEKTNRATVARRRRLRLQRQRELQASHDRMLRELVLAQQVQQSMLPSRLPEVGSVRFGAALRPCAQLAGDFYNVFRLDRERVGVLLGDVMGHGAAAALLSVYTVQRLNAKRIEGHRYEILQPSEVLGRLNRDLLTADFPGEPFVTMVYGVLDCERKVWTYSSAGHPPAWLVPAAGPARALETHGPPLGVMESEYSQSEQTLAAGDRVVLFTDGVDTLNWPGVGPRTPGLVQAFAECDADDPQVQVDAVLACAQAEPDIPDDVALLMFRVD